MHNIQCSYLVGAFTYDHVFIISCAAALVMSQKSYLWQLNEMLTHCLVDVLQIENLLISNQGTIKLCDFGSATTVSHYPDYSWSAQKRSMVEDEVPKHADSSW